MNNNLDEAQRWLAQAEADLKVARWDFKGKFWWEVCFKSQQAVEKVISCQLSVNWINTILEPLS
jgi:HEPN domain-containing protein